MQIGHEASRRIVHLHRLVVLVDEDIHLLGLVGANLEMLLAVLDHRTRIQKSIGLDIAVLVDDDNTQCLHLLGLVRRSLLVDVGT